MISSDGSPPTGTASPPSGLTSKDQERADPIYSGPPKQTDVFEDAREKTAAAEEGRRNNRCWLRSSAVSIRHTLLGWV